MPRTKSKKRGKARRDEMGRPLVDAESKLWIEWRDDPGLFLCEGLGMTLWSKQLEIAYSVRDTPETMVPSCNGAGKTHITAGTVLHRGLTHRGIVLTTAPTWRQVVSVLWERIKMLVNQAPVDLGIDPGATGFWVDDNWFALGLSTNQPSRFQGFHDDQVTVVVDEAGDKDIGEKMWAAFDGCLTGPMDRLLGIGNPTERDTEFYRRATRWAPHRKTIWISAYDTPNVKKNAIVIPNLVSPEFVRKKEHDWGEDDPRFQARILGRFPEVSSDNLIPMAWLERAFNYKPQGPVVAEQYDGNGKLEEFIVEPPLPDLNEGHMQLGVDVARYGSDASCLVLRRGGKLVGMQVLRGKHTMQTANYALQNIRHWKPQTTYIDSVGIGAGVFDRVNEVCGIEDGLQDLNIMEFSAGNRAPDSERFVNQKSQAYWHFREKLQRNEVDLSALTREQRDMVEVQSMQIRYEPMSGGRTKVYGKEDVKRKTGRSPDELEAIIMAFWDDEPGVIYDDMIEHDGPYNPTEDYYTLADDENDWSWREVGFGS